MAQVCPSVEILKWLTLKLRYTLLVYSFRHLFRLFTKFTRVYYFDPESSSSVPQGIFFLLFFGENFFAAAEFIILEISIFASKRFCMVDLYVMLGFLVWLFRLFFKKNSTLSAFFLSFFSFCLFLLVFFRFCFPSLLFHLFLIFHLSLLASVFSSNFNIYEFLIINLIIMFNVFMIVIIIIIIDNINIAVVINSCTVLSFH